MILNNLGREVMTEQNLSDPPSDSTNVCVATFPNDFTFYYEVTSSDGFKLQGSIPPSVYLELSPPGKAPFTLNYGDQQHSDWMEIQGVGASDAVTLVWIDPKTLKSGGPTALVTKAE